MKILWVKAGVLIPTDTPSSGHGCKRRAQGLVGQFARLDLIHVTPHPMLTRLNGPYERVTDLLIMLGRVPVLRRVATSDVAANQA